MSKHSTPFIEVTTRYFIPMTSEIWSHIESTSLAEMMQDAIGRVSKLEPKARKMRVQTPENKKP